MPDQDGNPTEIVVYSWKPLWIYWPVYLALALTENDPPEGVSVRFSFPEITAPVNDQKIRSVLADASTKGAPKLAMALCEPGPTGALPDRDFSRIPVIWRMPHWLITARGTTHPANVFCYPEDTTSGDYARVLVGAGLVRGQNLETLPPDHDLTFLRNMAGAALTFTPSHLLDDTLVARQFPGPNRDITALMIPNSARDQKEPARPGLPELLRDAIRNHLQQVLEALANTHGDDALVKDLIRELQHMVRFYDAAGYPSSPEQLGTVLAEYIRQGCYFPYRVVGSALAGELSRITDEVLSEVKPEASKLGSIKLSTLLGAGRDWSELSFKERRSIWRSGRDPDHNEITLEGRITHARPGKLRPILTGTPVRRSPSDFPISLGSLNAAARRLACANDGNSLCLREVWEGMADGTELDPCFGCTVGGLCMAVVRSAASNIWKKLNKDAVSRRVFFGTCSTANVPQSILCWEDVRSLANLFADECQTRGVGDCRVNLCQPDRNGLLHFSILWNGDTGGGSGYGRAKKGILAWVASHLDEGREVVSAGFWREDSGYEPVSGLTMTPRCKCHEQYRFGYMAFFDPCAEPSDPAAGSNP